MGFTGAGYNVKREGGCDKLICGKAIFASVLKVPLSELPAMALSTALSLNKQIRTFSIDFPEQEESRRKECINNLIPGTLLNEVAQSLQNLVSSR